MRWSILIASLPSRIDGALALYRKIAGQVGNRAVEVLMLTDNRMRTVGSKRQALYDIAAGDYFSFVDDDDDVSDDYVAEVYDTRLAECNYDVICFPVTCIVEGKRGSTVTSTHYRDEQWEPREGVKRRPGLVHVWRYDLDFGAFLDRNVDEHDAFYAPAMEQHLHECVMDKPLYTYRTDNALCREAARCAR